MSKLIVLLSFALINTQILFGQNPPIPKNYSVIETVTGDLDKDGIQELTVAYNTQKEKEGGYESVPRELIIYKKVDNKWAVWKKSGQALYGSKDGGMTGDPFGNIAIQNGILLISQNGGSSWKWGHTDKYRFQDGTFYLIGYDGSFGKPCEHWTSVDFNLSTGKMIIKKRYEYCENEGLEQIITKTENETFYKKGLKITIEKRREKEIEIVTPKYGNSIYVSSKYD